MKSQLGGFDGKVEVGRGRRGRRREGDHGRAEDAGLAEESDVETTSHRLRATVRRHFKTRVS